MQTYRQRTHKSGKNIFMILKNITAKLKTVLSSASAVCQEGLYYFMLSWVTVQSFIAFLLARLFNKDIDQRTFPSDALMNLSFGILLAIILLLLFGLF
jgi:hypothetical protein